MVEDWITITKQLLTQMGFTVKTVMRGSIYGIRIVSTKTDKLVLLYQIVLSPNVELSKLLNSFFKELYLKLLPVEIGKIEC